MSKPSLPERGRYRFGQRKGWAEERRANHSHTRDAYVDLWQGAAPRLTAVVRSAMGGATGTRQGDDLGGYRVIYPRVGLNVLRDLLHLLR